MQIKDIVIVGNTKVGFRAEHVLKKALERDIDESMMFISRFAVYIYPCFFRSYLLNIDLCGIVDSV